MPVIKIEAIDTLFFRDGKPFSMGEETWADGIFPPNPSVLYGALRTKYFAEHPDEFSKANTENDPTKNLQILGFAFKINEDIQYPLPLDIHSEKKSKENIAYLLTLSDKDTHFIDNYPFSKILVPNEDLKFKVLEPLENGYITKANLEGYLNKEEKEYYPDQLTKYYVREPKIGIGREDTSKTSKEGQLYRVNLIRPSVLENKELKTIQFLIHYEGLNLPKKGFLKLGAESKIVNYTTVVDEITPKFKNSTPNRKLFKLYLSTPCYFENGSLPDWINETTLEGEYPKLKLKLLTAAVGKPIFIGGFDMKNKKPKPMRKYVPAGSVYYFEILEGSFEDVVKVFHGNSISKERANEGFGISYVGVVKEG